MSANQIYNGDRSREYKKNKVFKIDEIDYSRVIATRTYDVSLKNLLRELLRFLLFDYDFLYKCNESNILLAYSYLGKNRKDYDAIVNMFCECIEDRVDSINFLYKIRIKFFFKKIIELMKLYFKFSTAKICNPFFAAILTAQFVHYKKYIQKICSNKKYELLVSFCDATGIENMITQVAKKNGLKTATLQHGQYRVLKEEQENADIEAYENFISDYLLAWGEKTREEFVKAGISSKRIIPVGALKPFSYNDKLSIHKELKVFGVVLDGNVYHESNIRIIRYANYIARKHDLKYILRLHPKNNIDDYRSFCDKKYFVESISHIENEEYAKKVDFSLLHMTGVFVELLSINSPIFLMRDEYLADIFAIDSMCFSNESEIDNLYNYFKSNPQRYCDKQYKLYRKFNEGGNINENYKIAIEKIIKEKI